MSQARTYDIEVVDLPERPVVAVRGHVDPAGIPAFLGAAFGEIAALVEQQPGAAISGPPFARYETGTASGWDVQAGFPCAGSPRPGGRVEAGSLPAGPAARTLHVGTYETVPAAYAAVYAWLTEHGYRPSGPPWESYLDEPNVAAPRTEVYVPCVADPR